MGLGTGGGEWGGVGGTGKKAEFVLLAGPGAPEESPRRALVASVAGSGGQWWSHLAISSAVWARPGKPVVRGGGGGLPTNPDQSLPPVAMAAAAMPLCQTERGGKERERKKKKPTPIPWEAHLKTTSHRTRNAWKAQAAAGGLVGDLISELTQGPPAARHCAAAPTWA